LHKIKKFNLGRTLFTTQRKRREFEGDREVTPTLGFYGRAAQRPFLFILVQDVLCIIYPELGVDC